ncbi:DUF2339 domain-containing protein [Nocardia sp. NPDC060259]|uniref:DUF2339 domain-containing protein n=1 Tax=Nocardia sp. NPDC060259 TaxID=3347088 RepID=UPI003649B7B4
MSTSIDPALVARLSGEFTTLGAQMGRLGGELEVLRAQLQGEVHRSAVDAQAVAGRARSSAPGAEWAGRTSDPGRRAAGNAAEGEVPAGGVPGVVGGSAAPSDSDTAAASGAPAGDSTVSGAVSRSGELGQGGVVAESAAATGASSGASAASSVPSGAAAGGGVPVDLTAEGASGGVLTGGLPAPGGVSAWGVPVGREMPVGGPSGGVPFRVPVPGGVPVGGAPIPAGWAPGYGPATQMAAAQPVPPPAPGYGGWAGTPGYGPAGWVAGVGQRGTGWVAPLVRGPRTPWWQREGVISRVLAVAGVGVTLIGVLMLLVLAAQAGFFGPVARVVAGGVLSVGLVGSGWRVFGRPGGRVGGIALVATGIAGAYLDVVAVTGYYRWVEPGVGLAVALVVALIGVGIAMRWQSQPLAVGVVLGAALLSPALTTELMLLGFLVVLQAAGVPVQMRREWPALHVARTLPVVLAALSVIALSGISAAIAGDEVERRGGLLVAAVACAVVGLAGAVLVVRRRPGDITASITIALTALPLFAAAMLFDRVMTASITGALAAVLLGLAATTLVPGLADRLGIPRHTALVSALTGAVSLLLTCVSATGSEPHLLPTVLFAVALAFLAVAATSRTRVGACVGIGFALLGGLVLLAIASPETLALHRLADQRLDIATAAAAVLGLGVAAMVAWTVPRLPGWADQALVTGVWIAVSVAGLYYVLVAAVSLGVSLGGSDGFILGHSLATIVWMVAATASLFYGLRRLSRSPAVAKVCLVSGLLVAAAALAKLFLFDLSTLSGLVRVAAFLVVGILLLLTGTRYARAFADSRPADPAT